MLRKNENSYENMLNEVLEVRECDKIINYINYFFDDDETIKLFENTKLETLIGLQNVMNDIFQLYKLAGKLSAVQETFYLFTSYLDLEIDERTVLH